MSAPRRPGGEINILAMLDGQVSRPLARRLKVRPALLWYGGAGVLALGLVGTLVWLAQGALPRAQVAAAAPVLAATAPPAAGPVPPPIPAPVPVEAAAPATALPAPTAATVAAPLAAVPDARPSVPEPRLRPVVVHVPVAVRPAGRPAPRRRRAPAPSKSEPAAAPVDQDVTWISAIMQHQSSRQGAPEPACTSRPCIVPVPGR